MKKITLIFFGFIVFITNAQEKTWSLEDCIQYAVKENITVNKTELNIKTAEQNLKADKGQFLPNVNGSASQNFGFGDRYPFSDATSYTTNLGVSASQTIFNGFRNTLTYKQSKLNVEAAQLELARIKDNISLNVVNTYLSVLLAQENVKIAEAQVAFSKTQVVLLSQQVGLGARAEADLLDVKATLANDEQRLVNTENDLVVAKLALTQLLQLKQADIQVVSISERDVKILLPKTSTDIFNQALAKRNEIKLARKNMDVADKGVAISKSGFLPTVSATYSWNTASNFNGRILNNPDFFNQLDLNKSHNVGLSISIPIFNQYQNKTNVARAKIQKQQVVLDFEQEKINLCSNIERAFTDLQNAEKSYDAATKLLEAQQFTFDNAKKQLELGAINVFDLEQIRNRYISAKLSLTNTKYDRLFKQKVLEFYSGVSLWGTQN